MNKILLVCHFPHRWFELYKKQNIMVKYIMKKCPNCHKKCIDVLEYSGKCPCCKEAIQTPVFFSVYLMIFLMIIMSVGVYINSYFLITFAFLMIVIYKLFSYQIDLLLFPLMVKNE